MYRIGVDIGGTKVAVGLVKNGKIIKKATKKVAPRETLKNDLEKLIIDG